MKSLLPCAASVLLMAGCGHAASGAAASNETLARRSSSHPVDLAIDASLAEGDAQDEDGGYFDDYPVDLRPGWSIRVSMVSDDIDTYLTLRDSSGAELVENDDDDSLGGSGLNSRVVFTASEAGTYVVRAGAYSSEESGAYRLVVIAGPDVAPATEAEQDASDETSESCEPPDCEAPDCEPGAFEEDDEDDD